MNKFSEFAVEEIQFTGDKVSIDKLVNVPIIVRDFKLSESKFKKTNAEKCMTIQFEYKDKDEVKYVFFTGSTVLINQCEKYKDKMPFATTIIKVNKYFSFS